MNADDPRRTEVAELVNTCTVCGGSAALPFEMKIRPAGSGSGLAGSLAGLTFRTTSKSSGELNTSPEVTRIVP